MTRGTCSDDSQPPGGVLDGKEPMVHTSGPVRGSSTVPVSASSSLAGVRVDGLWERVFSQANMARAVRQVVGNGGAAGIDEMTVDQLDGWLECEWSRVLSRLEDGSFRPSPLLRVEIPKPGGGRRVLGIPVVVDRVIGQAICQVLVPVFDPGFSDQSFGYRPHRSAHQAVETARGFVSDGYRWAVEIDLERFFDRVNHDMVMARVARRVADKRLLKLIREFVEAGVMIDGVRQPVTVGTPQGSPLSPLLSNIMLDDLDRELERRDHRFVRYADDVRIYVRSERAAERVLSSMTDWIEKRLKLVVNRDKSGFGLAVKLTLLGFGLYTRDGQVLVRVAPKAMRRMRQRIRELTSRSWGVSLSRRVTEINRFVTGWVGYFRLADTPSLFERTDQWLRRRLRQAVWEGWKNNTTRVRELRRLGANDRAIFVAVTRPSAQWRASHSQVMNQTLTVAWWRQQGLTGFSDQYHRHR